jgi:RsiW-degrading membrane proteinase PrsW (M82 family)
MSTSNQNQPESSDEERFIQRAMADIDKAAKVRKIKQIVVKGILLGALVWMVIREPGPAITSAMVILGLASLIVAILFRIDSCINKNTTAILRAIAGIEALVRNQENRGKTGL